MLPYHPRVDTGYTEVMERTCHELFDLVEPASNTCIELARGADKLEKAWRVHLNRGVANESRKLLGVSLWPRDDEAHPMFPAVRRGVDHSTYEFSD